MVCPGGCSGYPPIVQWYVCVCSYYLSSQVWALLLVAMTVEFVPCSDVRRAAVSGDVLNRIMLQGLIVLST